jgi:hypothetical protein
MAGLEPDVGARAILGRWPGRLARYRERTGADGKRQSEQWVLAIAPTAAQEACFF